MSVTDSRLSTQLTDHYLVSYNLQLAVEQPSVVSFSYRDIKKINLDAFRDDLAQSQPFGCTDDLDANAYAALINQELTRLMDQHAPVKRRVKRRGKNDCRWLSSEARAAKQLRRRLERRYRRTGKKSDKEAYDAAAVAAHSSIMKSRADTFRGQLEEVQGDQRATWRVSNRLLHSKPPVYYSDDDCARLSSRFSQFFVDKLNRISDSIATKLSSSAATTRADRTHSGQPFNSFSAVSPTDVQRLLANMPAKSSRLTSFRLHCSSHVLTCLP